MTAVDFSGFYKPATAMPFQDNDEYTELDPCDDLKPFVRCFWGTRRFSSDPRLLSGDRRLVIPDTCVDIILTVSDGALSSIFCGLNDAPFYAHAHTRPYRTFGVRFYFWAAALFSEESMRGTLNMRCDVDAYFKGFCDTVGDEMQRGASLEECIQTAQKYLIKRLERSREICPAVQNALYHLLREKGRTTADELARRAAVGTRQLERLFSEYIGIAPKKLAGLVRYQCLWQEIFTNPAFNVLDAVERFGFSDQSHLLKDFRRYHGMTPSKALHLAQDVAFLQDHAKRVCYTG